MTADEVEEQEAPDTPQDRPESADEILRATAAQIRAAMPSARPRGRRRSDSLVRVKGIPSWKARKILGRD